MGANANEAHRPSETLLQEKDLTESINEPICPASILIDSTRERVRPQGYFRLGKVVVDVRVSAVPWMRNGSVSVWHTSALGLFLA